MKSKSLKTITLVAFLLCSFIVIGNLFAKTATGDQAFLGIYPSDIDDIDVEALNLKNKDGVMINDVVDDGPAETAGLKSGDILVKIGDSDLESMDHMRDVLKKLSPDDKVKVAVLRDGNRKTFDLILGSKPKSIFFKKERFKKHAFLGVVTISIKDQLAEYFGVKAGALIEDVVADRPAEKAGLKAGDVIVRIDKDVIESRSDLQKAMRERDPGTEVEIIIYRERKEKSIPVVLGETETNLPGVYSFDFNSGDFDFDIDVEDLINGIRELEIIEKIEMSTKDKEELRQDLEELREELQELKQELKEEKKKKTKEN